MAQVNNEDLPVLEKLLQTRIDLAAEDINRLRNEIASLAAIVKNAKDRLGKKHRESLEEILQHSEEIERNHSVQIQTSESERAFMREMNNLKQKRKDVAEYNVAKVKLDEQRAKLAELIKERGERETTLEELYVGIRRIRGAIKCGCAPADVTEVSITVPPEKLPSIIGRGGSQMKFIESVSSAIIDIDKSSTGSVRLVGTPTAIASAHAAIKTIVDTAIEEWELAEAAITCMLLNKGELITEIQDTYNVKIDISKAKKLCKIAGLGPQVESAKAIINNIDSYTVKIPVTVDLLPLIVGKGGSMIRALEDESGGGVYIDIDREANIIVVQGYRSNVQQIATTINTIISENREIEEKCTINRQFLLESVIGAGGAIIRILQRDLGVGINAPKLESSSAGPNSDYEPCVLTIKGPTNKVLVAKAAIINMWQDYMAKFTEFEVPLSVVPAIVGKKGSRVKALREAYPTTTIAINGSTVKLHGDSESDRAALKAAIEAIVDENYSSTFAIDNILAVLLKSGGGEATRALLQSASIYFDISTTSDDEDEATIELRGTRANVDKGIRILNEFVESHFFESFTTDKEDLATLVSPNRSQPDSFTKQLEKKFGVNISVIRKKNSIRVFGNRDSVVEAIEAARQYLDGRVDYNTVVLPIAEEVVSAVVGKGGATINSFQKEHNVKVDILKARGLLRMELCGVGSGVSSPASSAGRLSKAVVAMKKLIGEARMTVTIDISSQAGNSSSVVDEDSDVENSNANTTQEAVAAAAVAAGGAGSSNSNGNINKAASAEDSVVESALRSIRSRYDTEVIRTSKSKIVVRGRYNEVSDCVAAIKKSLLGQYRYRIEVNARQLQTLIGLSAFASIRDKATRGNVAIVTNIISNIGIISVTGTTTETDKTKAEIWRLLDCEFPSEFVSVVMPLAALRELGQFASLIALEETTQALLRSDKECLCVRIRGSTESVALAAHLLSTSLTEWLARHRSLAIDEYLLKSSQNPIKSTYNKSTTPSFLTRLNAIEKETKTKIVLNRAELQLDVSGEAKANVDRAIVLLQQYVELVASERWEVSIPASFIGAFIGKEGSKLKKTQEEFGVDINIDKKSNIIKVNGTADSIASVKQMITRFIKEEQDRNHKEDMLIPVAAFPLVIGPKGATAKDIQERSGCRLDLNRDKRLLVLLGSPESCKKATDIIRDMLQREGFDDPKPLKPVVTKDEEEDEDAKPVAKLPLSSIPMIPPGASPAMIKRLMEANLGKSVIRRRRKREALAAVGENDDNEECEGEGDQAAHTAQELAAVGKAASQAADLESRIPPAPSFVRVGTPHVPVKPVIVVTSSPPPLGAGLLRSSLAVSRTTTAAAGAGSGSSAVSVTLPAPAPAPAPVAVSTASTVPASTVPSVQSSTAKVAAVSSEVAAVAPSGGAVATAVESNIQNGSYFKSKSGLKIRL